MLHVNNIGYLEATNKYNELISSETEYIYIYIYIYIYKVHTLCMYRFRCKQYD